MKKYHQYKNIRKFANAFAKNNGQNSATTITPTENEFTVVGVTKPHGYRKYSTGEYVPNAYRNNFGWKNTYYQRAVFEVKIPLHIYLWFGWRI